MISRDLGWILRMIVALGCAYELVALPHRSPFPTISELANRATYHRHARFAIWWFVGYAAAHLFGVDRVSKEEK